MPRYLLSLNLKRMTVIAAAVLMSGTVLAPDARLSDTKPPELLNRPFGIGLSQIEYCFLKDRRNDQIALFEHVFKCPIENQR